VRLALFSIVVIPVIVVMSGFFFKKIMKSYERYQEQDATLSTILQENLSGVRVVKAFARQAFERDKFERANWEKYGRGRKLTLMHSLYWPLSDMICGAQMVGGFLLAGWMALNGEITLGTYVAYNGLVIQLIFPMRNLGRLIVQTSTGMVSYGRVMTVLRQQREPVDEGTHHPAGNVQGRLVFDDVG
jgi:ATP-binding cassette subfamily B protein